MKYCLNCKKVLTGKQSKYCSNQCQRDHQYSLYIQRWKNGEESGIRGEYQLSHHIRRYMLEKADYCCEECGWNKINPHTGLTPLEIDHIDGNYQNNKESNLRVLCPNCHSLTATYKGANRGSGRVGRKKYSL